ncbi:MAG: nuclear transport factor 2 family protein [Bacteroidia bacterium]|jgi:ketosteroid isomerase-like protein|nr:nuclear transport factor 2 family protein [Bacteroidia bacterium]
MRLILTLTLLAALTACETKRENLREKSIAEIRAAEKAFETMCAEKSVAEAFYFYADSQAVIKRQNDTLITGREGIRNYHTSTFYKTAKVKWSPDYVDASESGDLGHSYGRYEWTYTDTSGKVSKYPGVYHTVWKRQKDGSWKYVWD